jgi:hypothetical protein
MQSNWCLKNRMRYTSTSRRRSDALPAIPAPEREMVRLEAPHRNVVARSGAYVVNEPVRCSSRSSGQVVASRPRSHRARRPGRTVTFGLRGLSLQEASAERRHVALEFAAHDE